MRYDRMKPIMIFKTLAALAAAFFIAGSALAQTSPVTNHAFPIGKGVGNTGYTSLLCGSAQLAVGQSAADPICRTLTGDVTLSAAGATAIANNAVTNAKLAQMAASTVKCNNSGALANASDCVIVNAKWLGAVGNNVADDTTALQLCITTAIGLHGSCYIPAGQYKTTVSLTGGSHVHIYGDGAQSSGQQCYTSAGCANLNAAAMANATTILPGSTISAFNIASDDAVQIHDLQVGYTTQPTALSGVTCFIIGPTATNRNVSQTSIWNTMCSGADRGIYSLNCIHCSFHHNHFYNEVSFSIYVDGTPANTNGNVGDSEIANNTFVSGSATAFTHININAGGGWRIVNNKLDTGGSINATHGILIDPQATNASIEPLVITGNSIEGCNICIHYTSPGTGVTATQGVISGNQIWASNNATLATKGNGIVIDSGAQWVSGLEISGNFINVDGGGSATNISIGNSSASNIGITGNVLGNNSGGSVGISLGTGLTNIQQCANTPVSGTSLAVGCNVSTGYQIGGAAASNHILLGNGTNYVDSALGTSVATALGTNVGTAGAFVVNGGALGTPSSGTLTNATGLPTTGLTGTLQAAQEPAHTGDCTNSAGALALTCTQSAADFNVIGILKTGGDTRVSTQFDKTNSAVLANVPGLSVTLTSGLTYGFEAELYTTSNAASGVQAAIGGTVTATAFTFTESCLDAGGATCYGRSGTLGATPTGVTSATTATIKMIGTITVNAGGTLTAMFAQNVSGGTASSVLVGSTMRVWKIQ